MRTLVHDGMVVLIAVSALRALASERRPARAAFGAWAALTASLLVAAFVGADGFDALRLFSHALFVLGPAYLFVAAALLKKESRRAALVAAGLAVVVVAVGVDAFVVEPGWLEVTRPFVKTERATKRLAVAVLADLQMDEEIGARERAALEAVRDAKPDLILLPGDFLQIEDPVRRAEARARARALFAEVPLAAPLGVHAVAGNTDTSDWPELFRGTAVVVHLQHETIDLGPLLLTALPVAESRDPALRVARAEKLHVAFGHYPDFALGDVEADLLVAGHTHGGQVRLPGIGPLMTLSRVPRAWAAGVTRLDGGRTLVVSRGVGMERAHAPRLRFLCRPEVVVIDLAPMSEGGVR